MHDPAPPPPTPAGPAAAAPEARGTPDGDPTGWTALWQAMLAAHAGPADGADPAAGGLVHDPVTGWTWCAPEGDSLAPWFELYKPLLDARHAQLTSGAGAWVIAQLGQSLDGCVATAGGDSYFVTGPQSLTHLHRLRALCDAVIVGAGTVAADDPQLTTRRVPGPQPVRVVLDPRARLDGSARVLRDGVAPTLWVCDADHAAAARARLA
ncbi:MAG: RibD family protein, partial [Rubrivivax sp.]